MTEIWRTKEIFVILASTIKNIDNVNYPMYPESQNDRIQVAIQTNN